MANPELASEDVYTLDDFIHGRPEQLIQADPDADPRIFVLWPHGNEKLGPKVGHRIYTTRPELQRNVDYMCGNPLAAGEEPQQRYTTGTAIGYDADGTDLNRSFSPSIEPRSYEEHRARQIASTITNGGYKYVMDLHTSTTELGSCFLISERYREEQAVRDIIAASPISRVVVLPELIPFGDKQVPLVTTGLIGNFDNSVSVEYNAQHADESGVGDIMITIDGLVAGKPLVTPRDREFYTVTDFIWKTQDPGEDAKNFEKCEFGYYPVLYGENSYRTDPTKPYLGFAATSRDVEFF
jgi:hypothetical protein